MKYLLLTALLAFIASCGGDEKAKAKQIEASATENGLMNSSGITTEQMNPSPNPAPRTEAEVIENSTLTNKNIPGKNEIQAEEDAMDYSTTPEEKPRENSGKPTEIGN